MTTTQFRSLETSMFATLVNARHGYVAAFKAYSVAEDACTCEGRRCKCAARTALTAYEEAGRVRQEREAAWVAYHAAK
tara:strand:- start:134 stop:367 length:234 start_codon:yes stop_codon:yes gene_type:complete